MSTTRMKVQGLAELRGKLKPELMAGPLRQFFRLSSSAIRKRARANAPVDTGRLRASLKAEVDHSRLPLWAKVGTDVHYGLFQEFGTGAFGKSGEHTPPGEPLDAWAKARGFESGWHAARAIGRRGGVRARPFLRPALKQSMADIKRFVRNLGRDIEARFGR